MDKAFMHLWAVLALTANLTGCGGGDPEPLSYTSSAYDHIDVGRMYRYEDGTLILIGSLQPGKEGVSTVCEIKPQYFVHC
jgi:hypothetical protein